MVTSSRRPGRPLPSLLLVDMLGVRARWAARGVQGASAAFDILEDLVEESIEAHPSGVLHAEIESDLAVILCRTTNSAMRVGQNLFRGAFLNASSESEQKQRTWLRGVIVSRPPGLRVDQLRRPRRVSDVIRVHDYHEALLGAVSIEKSGFRGMRIVVEPRLLTTRVREALNLRPEGPACIPLVRLSGVHAYPPRLNRFEDLLWMATDDGRLRRRLNTRMTRRLRLAAYDDEEVRQAAATQTVFDAAETLLAE